MKSFFATVNLIFDDTSTPNSTALAEEVKTLGLAQQINSTEGHPVELPKNTFAGQFQGEDKKEIDNVLRM